MNYIQIEIGGKLRGWKVNQLTLEEWSKRMGTTNTSALYSAIYAGLIANCYVKSEEPDFTFENVCDWTDKLISTNSGMKIVEVIKETFEKSEAYISAIKRLQELTEAVSDKKKVRKKT